MTKALALIPARGGSKGVPRKNIQILLGKPLIAWTIETALQASSVGRVVVSTDDAEIAEVAKTFGAEVPFMRPAALAQDDTPDFPVLAHALENIAAEVIVWLRPTAPLRTVADIDQAIATLAETGADSVRSVSTSKAHPYWMKTLDGDILRPFVPDRDERSYPRRQTLPPAYVLNGVVDVTTAKTAKGGTMWGEKIAAYVMPADRAVDIDTETDFTIAESLLQRRV